MDCGMVCSHGVSKRFGSVTAVDGADLCVERGEFVALLGPSGCGKTTLLRSIVGVQIIESGSVTVLGLPAGAADLRLQVGYVTQAPSVYADLTAIENLRFFAAVLGVPGAHAEEALRAVGLSGREDLRVDTMSGGQRARVSLATALLGSPTLLILDEPTVGLDPVLREQLWELFADLAARGSTLIVSSHVMDEAERCDDLLLMREGALLATGTPAELTERVDARNVGDAFLKLIETAGDRE
jgi:ABC-2 type transport system ATP-binding protein